MLYDYRMLSTMQRCFQRWRPLASLDEKDGYAFGKILMENTSKLFNVKKLIDCEKLGVEQWVIQQLLRPLLLWTFGIWILHGFINGG